MQRKNKKIISLLLICMLALIFAGCSRDHKAESDKIGSNGTENEETNNNETSNGNNVLIVYFSHSGNTEKLSGMIESETGANVFRIVPETAYGDDLFERAQNELNDGTRPKLSSHLEKDAMAQYDTILLGFPIWWYDLPMPVRTFLEEYDLAGKTIIPYFTHKGSSGGAGSLETIETLCPDSTVKTDAALSIAGESVEDAEEQVQKWISGLGL